MLAFSQTFKNTNNNSIYTSRNNTNQLYEPLRVALRKSTLAMGYLSTDKRANYENRSNGKKMRMLSPTQAENIKNGIFIPANKQLIPTRNIQKVIGKKFTAVDFTQKIGEPLTPQQFNMMRQGAVSQIVYEIQQFQPNYQNSKENQLYKLEDSHRYKQELPKPLFVGHSSKDLIQGRQLSLSLANSPTQPSNSKKSPSKPYQFKQNIRDNSNIMKDKYKYNVEQYRGVFCYKGCCSQTEPTDFKIQQQDQ